MFLEDVVPWGRSFSEYLEMFNLRECDLRKTILGCGDGPASFNAELSAQGGSVVSVDPIYQFSTEQIRSRISDAYSKIIQQMENNIDDYVWKSIQSLEELSRVRMSAMQQFLMDFEAGLIEGRYVHGSLPKLPFHNQHCELALCSHLLFLYSEHFSLEMHIESITELCRVADEVRIYPLITLDGHQSEHLQDVIKYFTDKNMLIRQVPVSYEFQKGASEMLVIKNLS